MRSTVLLCVFLVAGCATPSGQREPAPFAYSRGVVANADLPAGHVVTDGAQPLHLRLAGDDTATLEPASEADANFVVSFEARDHDRTMVVLKQSGARTLKVDLWISPDGERWQYTSSCPLPPDLVGLESWPHEIPFLAIGNPRWVEGEAGTCE